MIQEHNIQTTKTSRYFTLGKLTKDVKIIWIVFHGYGQLGKEFLSQFEFLGKKDTFIISIEALNKFYFRGFNGKVGASWMTKENRESEINDYVQFIDNVYRSVTDDINLSKMKINILGFSQGTHTASRWLYKKRIKINNLILWSGSFPHDFNYNNSKKYWSSFTKYIVIGKKDKFIEPEKFKMEMNYLSDQNIHINVVEFDGGHEIDKNTLLKISTSL